MKIEELLAGWSQDSKVDKTELGDESLRTIQLHQKWKEIYFKEKAVWLKQKADLKELSFQKYEFYTLGPTPESNKLGWELPPRGKILRSDIERYLEADKDIIKATLQLELQKEKVEFCKEIVDEIQKRRWAIKYAIDWIKWTQGD